MSAPLTTAQVAELRDLLTDGVLPDDPAELIELVSALEDPYCHAKQAPGWRQRVADDGLRHEVETITPSGHRYRSTAPPPVGWREPRWVRQRPVYTLIA